MTIQNTDIVIYKASKTTGKMLPTVLLSDIKNALFKDVSQAERASGSHTYEKVFVKVQNADNTVLSSVKIMLDEVVSGLEQLSLVETTESETETELRARVNSTFKFPIGVVNNATTGNNTISIDLNNTSNTKFSEGKLVRITLKANVNDAGAEEYVRLGSEVSINIDNQVFNLDSPIVYDYPGTAKVEACIEIASIKAIIVSAVWEQAGESLSGVLIEEASISNRGGITQQYTLTFESASVFRVAGDVSGALDNGSIYSSYEVLNPENAEVMLHLTTAFWDTARQLGDIITIVTKGSYVPVFVERIVPVDCPVNALSRTILFVDGENV